MCFLLFLIGDRIRSRIRIHTSDQWIWIQIQEAQKHTDPTDPDPQHWSPVRAWLSIWLERFRGTQKEDESRPLQYSILSACRALIVRPWLNPFLNPNFHSAFNSFLLRVARRQCGATWRMCTRRWRWRWWRRRLAPTSTCLPTCSRAAASFSHSWGLALLLVSRQFIYSMYLPTVTHSNRILSLSRFTYRYRLQLFLIAGSFWWKC